MISTTITLAQISACIHWYFKCITKCWLPLQKADKVDYSGNLHEESKPLKSTLELPFTSKRAVLDPYVRTDGNKTASLETVLKSFTAFISLMCGCQHYSNKLRNKMTC